MDRSKNLKNEVQRHPLSLPFPTHPKHSPQCFNVTTVGYGQVQRCKSGRICEVCKGLPGERTCVYVRVTGNPGSLTGQTSLSNVVIPGD